ncbi:MAG: hypothetical protein J7501_09850 [Bdellovibrio sp.]|nr:hypothetical protein [Bdellovibrio sp.]
MAVFSHAKTSATQAFEMQANHIPQSILDRCGVSQVGALNLKDLVKNTKKIKWQVVGNSMFVTDSSGKGRLWAIHDRKNKTVLVNGLSLQATTSSQRLRETIPAMSLHEALRDFGVDDEDYQVTLALDIVKDTCDTSLVQGVLEKATGGVTSTGGGGNDAAVYVKRTLLILTSTESMWSKAKAANPKMGKWTRQEFVKLVLGLKIEYHDYVSLATDVVVKNGQRNYLIPHLIFQIQNETYVHQFWVNFIRLLVENET